MQLRDKSIVITGAAQKLDGASLILFSDDSTYFSGANLPVDGAWTCGAYLQNQPVPEL